MLNNSDFLLKRAVVAALCGQVEGLLSFLSFFGFELISQDLISEDDVLTRDGRELLKIGECVFALRPEVHSQRLAASFEAARQQSEPEIKSVAGTELMSAITCPKCGDALQHTAVCPSCAAGKLGYHHRYACVCGGTDLISKDKL